MTDDLLCYLDSTAFALTSSELDRFPAHHFYYCDCAFRVTVHKSRYTYNVLCSTDEYGCVGISYGYVVVSKHRELNDAIKEYRFIVNRHCASISHGEY